MELPKWIGCVHAHTSGNLEVGANDIHALVPDSSLQSLIVGVNLKLYDGHEGGEAPGMQGSFHLYISLDVTNGEEQWVHLEVASMAGDRRFVRCSHDREDCCTFREEVLCTTV